VIHAAQSERRQRGALRSGSSTRSPWPAAARPVSRPARGSLTWSLPDDCRGRRLAGRRPGGPDRLRGGERGPGCGVPVCCRCGSALMAAQPAAREIGCTCGRAWAGW